MTAQPSTKSLNSADFTAALRNLSSGGSVATTSNSKNSNCKSNSNLFNSEDFQRFLQEQKSTLAASASNDTTTSTGTPAGAGAGATQSLDQLFSTSEFIKSQQFSDIFKSQHSFSQMFQSKDSFADLFKSLDNDQKKALFSSSDAAMKEPLSPPAFPPMEGSVSRTSSTRSLRSSSLMTFQSTDWKNLGSHVDVNYPHSKLFRDNSASTNGTNNDEPMSSIQRQQHQQLQPQQQQQQQQQQIEPAAASKTDWSDVYFAQLQAASAVSTAPTSAASAASTAPTTTAPVVPPTPKTLPVPLPKKNKKTATKKTAGQGGKRYIPNPTETDILMGRGGKSNHHPGNKRYREEILNFKKTYAQLQNKEDKTDLSRNVIDYVHKYNGRFLAMDKTVKPACWYEITNTVARRKVSQALREDVDPVKRQQKRARFLERKRQKEEEA